MEGDGPIMGTPRHAGVLVMGTNLPAVDATRRAADGDQPLASRLPGLRLRPPRPDRRASHHPARRADRPARPELPAPRPPQCGVAAKLIVLRPMKQRQPRRERRYRRALEFGPPRLAAARDRALGCRDWPERTSRGIRHDWGNCDARSGRTWDGLTLGVTLLALGLAAVAEVRADESRLAEYFGFLPLEIYKLDTRINSLLLAGPRRRQDRRHHRHQQRPVAHRPALERQEARRGGGAEPPKSEANEVVNDRRMRLVSVPVNKEVVSLQVGDFNGDGKPDLAFYGTPAELVVLAQRGGRRIPRGQADQLGRGRRDSTALRWAT